MAKTMRQGMFPGWNRGSPTRRVAIETAAALTVRRAVRRRKHWPKHDAQGAATDRDAQRAAVDVAGGR